MNLKRDFSLFAVCLLPIIAWSQSPACLVIGPKDAKVMAPEGVKSPVFLAPNCSALKLVSGKAQASWIGRDGKPRLIPITEQGVATVPASGSEERSVNTVWAELTSLRERQQPAYMRSFGGDRVPKVFVPSDGLTLLSKVDSDAVLSVSSVQDDKSIVLLRQEPIPAGQPAILRSDKLLPGETYVIQIQRGDLIEEWRWRMASAQEAADIAAQIQAIDDQVQESAQRDILQAMLFEQLKMRVNMDFIVHRIRAKDVATQS